MSRVRVSGFGVSADGFGAGPDQNLENPLGVGGEQLHQWAFATRTFRAMFGEEGGSTGIDERFAAGSMEGIGAWILGRNMFGPVRGEWPDLEWRGWWGDNPPYHVPVFVLTHHARPNLEMEGGTVFHFVNGPEEALERAREAAGGKDVRVGGGLATIRHYLETQALDELHLAMVPVLLGRGEAMFAGLDLPSLGYRVTESVLGEQALHLKIGRVG
ncbi:DNA-binding protein [Agrobacterium tumefaciens CCNWGS0286]|uniref:dihydrofolate reductase family protein n=1 Tax=Agrobacterium tumefaciens TaxID=358 RepID=UPI00023346AC|nr:dihydrofolate reductase family protein [Agrobacterium tumefaciens]EHH02587.1 DNA-binding protein [Agrobacterium tumefaciens CCNWGS0286]